jgi:hypothetical protein
MVDRLHKSRSNNWANTGISNSGKLSGSKSSSSAQEGGRNFGTDQYRENYPVLDSIVFGIRGTAFRFQCIPYLEALHPEALPHNPQHAFTTCLWKLPALRHRDARYPTIRSCDHFRNLISKVFTTAKKWGFHSGDNPALNVELPQKTFVREKHILTGKQIPQLLKELPERIRVMVHLAILTGLRVGELLALKYRDLDWETGVLRVEQTYYRGHTGTPKTKGSKRHLPLPQSLLRTYTELQKLLRRIQINLCSRREPESRTAIPTSCTAT